jgi:hypothetical protein
MSNTSKVPMAFNASSSLSLVDSMMQRSDVDAT